jgi:hypothetical protein
VSDPLALVLLFSPLWLAALLVIVGLSGSVLGERRRRIAEIYLLAPFGVACLGWGALSYALAGHWGRAGFFVCLVAGYVAFIRKRHAGGADHSSEPGTGAST